MTTLAFLPDVLLHIWPLEGMNQMLEKHVEESQGHILNPFSSFSFFSCPHFFFLSTRRDVETSWKIRSRKLSKEAAPRFPAGLCVAIYSSEFPPSTTQAQSHPSLPWQQGRAGSLYVASTVARSHTE